MLQKFRCITFLVKPTCIKDLSENSTSNLSAMNLNNDLDKINNRTF